MSSIEFGDGKKVQEDTRWLNALVEKQYYKKLKEQCETDSHHNWGDNLNVLIMSDRCPGRAKGLHEYLTNKTNLSSVKLCEALSEAKEYSSSVSIDILIFVGYQKDESNYEIKKLLEEKNPNTHTVKYAFLDHAIQIYCMAYKIHHAFSSEKPAADFVSYLENLEK